ncbi:acyl carrier protein [Pararhodobacter marinus]|uniref:Carrier domain-containing protein n=1 Tax=Pararhodobacter marinus TaxID=2184063 RepID=A0A2U2CFX0_9RHOB|nr:acyl carrier protein [Pararhodobacter marinus]PWE30793.1 hypothetical protein C4N9_03280 [Pararhodobacter marinus]
MTALIETELFQFLRAQVVQRSRAPAERVTPDAKLSDLGMQSIDAVLLCGEIEDRFEVEIDPSEIFEHETVGDFAQSVLGRLAA